MWTIMMMVKLLNLKILIDISAIVILVIVLQQQKLVAAATISKSPENVGTVKARAILANSYGDEVNARGCYHNGTWYANGSLVPTMEPCLNCKCVNRNLICSLRICPEQPVPPPRGCVLVQGKKSCCSYLMCLKYHQISDRHSHRGGGISNEDREDDSDQLRIFGSNSLYRRIEDDEDTVEPKNDIKEACIHNGTIYESGSAMATSTLCSYCYCIGGKQRCVKPKCLLAPNGCEPIYADSICCPIRYDCRNNTTVKPMFRQKSNFRKSNNKHYLRTATRNQRSSGCLQGNYFYLEGQQLPKDTKNPCDICFCIRGSRKCTPKKCTKSIRNCKPLIPPGQCCPASYDCNHSKEIVPRSLSNVESRQFDFYSLFFGDDADNSSTDHIPVQSPSTEPSVISSTSQKGFFDALRDGLNYLDSNNENVEAILDSSVNTSEQTSIAPNTTKEFSLFDLLLGEEEKEELSSFRPLPEQIQGNSEKISNLEEMVLITPPSNSTFSHVKIDSEAEKEPSLSDLFSGLFSDADDDYYSADSGKDTFIEGSGNDNENVELNTKLTDNLEKNVSLGNVGEKMKIENFTEKTLITTTRRTTISRIQNTRTTEKSLPLRTASSTLSVVTSTPFIINSTSLMQNKIKLSENLSVSKDKFKENPITTSTERTVQSEKHETTTKPKVDLLIIRPTAYPSTSTSKVTKNPSITVKPIKSQNSNISAHSSPPIVITPSTDKMLINRLSTTNRPNQTLIRRTTLPPKENLISSLFDGISNIFNNNQEIDHSLIKTNNFTTTQIIKSTSPRPDYSSTTIVLPEPITKHSPIPSSKLSVTTEKRGSSLTTESPEKQLIISSNPSILETDLNYDYDDPTLPPSLPNLKIIPFLPTDAVKNDRNQLNYYQTTVKYPVLTEHYNNLYITNDKRKIDYHGYVVDHTDYPIVDKFSIYNLKSDGKQKSGGSVVLNSNVKIDYDVYEHTPSYPSITEKYDSLSPTVFPDKYGSYSGELDKLGKYSYSDYEYGSYEPVDKLRIIPDNFENQVKFNGSPYESSSEKYGSSGLDKFVTISPEKQVFNKIPFSTGNPIGVNKFSPPTKTEGGFVPKETGNKNFLYENYHNTKVIDLTTETALKNNLSGLVIGISTPDPFKNVIHTEPPPDLHSLIEDKEKLLQNHKDGISNYKDFNYSPISLTEEDDFGKDIISITTDVNYSSNQNISDKQILLKNSSKNPNHNGNINSKNSTEKNSIEMKLTTLRPTHKNVSIIKNATLNPPKDHDFQKTDDFLESVFGFLFRDDQIKDDLEDPTEKSIETKTIPPFKNISSTITLLDILNITKPKNGPVRKDVPQRINDKIYDLTTEPPKLEISTNKPENLNILRDVLLATFNSPSKIDEVVKRPADIKNSYLKHPITSFPFINPIFPAQSQDIDSKNTFSFNPIRSDLDLIIPELNKDHSDNNNYSPDGYQVLPEYSSISNTKSYVVNPVDIEKLKQHQSESGAKVYTKPTNNHNGISNASGINLNSSVNNSLGILKLAGCNIYGRMYRVGRIISELSGPCLECMCTEVGVHCTPLKC